MSACSASGGGVLGERRVRSPGSASTVGETVKLAEALLALEDWDAAKELLLEAEFYRPQQDGLRLALGVLCSGQGEYEAAIGHFRRAKLLGDGNLKAQSNLGEAYLKLGRKSEAEATYRAVLNQTPMHVESLLGMGEVLTAAGDAGEGEDSYPRAVECFTSAIELSTSHSGSKTLTKKELASAYYSRGYARARQFETLKRRPDFGLLKDALSDFRKSAEYAEDRLKPDQAAAKAGARLREFYAHRATDTWVPASLSILALLVFSLTQLSLWADKPHVEGLTLPYYAALTFTSLVLVIASVSLPSLLRIKLAGIELEKKPVEQIGTGTPLGISK